MAINTNSALPQDSMDIAGRDYWENVWSSQVIAEAPAPRLSRIRNHFRDQLSGFFRELFADLDTSRKQLIEAGCGNSVWLPYFAKQFGFMVAGLDYSESGCAAERAILARAGVAGPVVCADLFSPPAELRNRFDVVVSFGLVEHFTDTAWCVRALADLGNDGAIVVTLIPNMAGLVGWVTKKLNCAVYDMHVPLTRQQLAAAHAAAELEVLSSELFLSCNFGVVNLNGIPPGPARSLKQLVLHGLRVLTAAVWLFEQRVRHFPVSEAFSPYIICVARKPHRVGKLRDHSLKEEKLLRL